MTMYLREAGYEDGMRMKIIKNCVQWEQLQYVML